MLWRIIVQYLRPHWPLLLAVIGFQLLQSVAALFLPRLSADIVDIGIVGNDIPYILGVGAFMLALSLVQVLANVAAVYFGAKVAMGMGRDLRADIFEQVNTFSEREVNQFGAPSLITRTTNDVQQVQMLVLLTCTLLVATPILAVGGVVMALQQDLELSWLMVVSIPALGVSVGAIISRLVPLFRSLQRRIDRINQVLREQLTGIRVIRAFVREGQETERFAVANRELTDNTVAVGRYMALLFPIVMLVLNLSSIAVIWFGGFRVDDGSIQVGTVMAFLQYLMQVLMAMLMSTMMVMMVPRAAVCAERICEVLDTRSSVVPPSSPVFEAPDAGSIEFENVSFSYPGAEAPVLSELGFRIEAGTTTAIIGSTGSGKTTLVNLIPRLFDATAGTVRIGGVPVERLDPDTLWSMIALVPQRPYLFSGTVASNLHYGKPDAGEDELWRALEIAQGRDFVSAMPEGLHSAISQGGTNVSGGQRQRLAIARALVKGAPILIFDDSFSALDLSTDARLRKALDKHLGGTTKLIVAQRVSTITGADQILVLDHGRIVGRGTHEELLAGNSTYQEIVESQLTAQELA